MGWASWRGERGFEPVKKDICGRFVNEYDQVKPNLEAKLDKIVERGIKLEDTKIISEPNQQQREKQPPLQLLGVSGLGGWLVLVQIGIYLSILLNILTLKRDTIPAFAPDIWDALTSKDSIVYDRLWAPLLIFELVTSILFTLLSVFCLYNLYKKKAIFPKLMIVVYSAGLAIAILEYVLLKQIPIVNEYDLLGQDAPQAIIRTAVSCGIWIPYFLRSERVQNTFVN